MDCSQPILLEAGDNDVVLGRGSKLSERSGNKLFRELARQSAFQYSNAKAKAVRDKIAKQVLDAFASQSDGGRFLRPMAAERADGDTIEVFEEVDPSVTLTKTKQRLRDFAAAMYKPKVRASRVAIANNKVNLVTPPYSPHETHQDLFLNNNSMNSLGSAGAPVPTMPNNMDVYGNGTNQNLDVMMMMPNVFDSMSPTPLPGQIQPAPMQMATMQPMHMQPTPMQPAPMTMPVPAPTPLPTPSHMNNNMGNNFCVPNNAMAERVPMFQPQYPAFHDMRDPKVQQFLPAAATKDLSPFVVPQLSPV